MTNGDSKRAALAIRVDGLGKRYRLGAGEPGYETLRERLGSAFGAPWRRLRALARGEGLGATGAEIWALREVDFEIRAGEVVGVIGRNGAGKTTLLKVLSRITEPSAGRAEIRGRVGSLLEVGTGFHPELTGRENIFLASAILGMRRVEIERKLDAIVDFAEIGHFLDTPIKRYSSGMYVRLAFSVAAHLEPDILLVDEVLSVGDFAFQKKCLGRMGSLGEEGRTIFLVSHNLDAIRRLATRVIWIDRGRIAGDGDPLEILAAYLGDGAGDLRYGGAFSLEDHPGRAAGCEPVLREVWIEAGDQPGLVPMGADLEIRICFESALPLRNVYPTLAVEDPDGNRILVVSPRVAGGEVPESARSGTFGCRLDGLPLNPGTFYLTIQLQEGRRRVDRIDRACSFQVVARDVHGTGQVVSASRGFLAWPSEWRFQEEPSL
jgi:lipopolysaccharide transport system ATP-binding protein